MTDDTNVLQHGEQEGENLNPAELRKTPLDLVREQQAMQQQTREVIENRVESGAEVPGGSKPSDRRKHPQRQMYGSGTNES
jgi:hypothetical protein